jgi:lysophospholipase L1-like esterase
MNLRPYADEAREPAASPWKIATEKALLVAAGVCFALLFLEVGIRLVAPQNLRFFDDSDLRLNAWEFIPHAKRNDYIGVPVHINNVGLRGHDIAVPKPDGVYRIVALGDSITFGYGVPNEKTFPQDLERLLNQNLATSVHYEVVNAGVPGTGLSYYEYFVRKQASQLNPDLILICMALNDITVYHPSPTEPLVRQASRGRRFNYYLLRHSHLYQLWYVKLKSVLYGFGVLDLRKEHAGDFLPIEPPSPMQTRAWASTTAILDRIMKEVHEQGVQAVLVLFPLELQISTETLNFYNKSFHLNVDSIALAGNPQRILVQYARNHGVPIIDLLPAFRDSARNDLFLRNVSISFDPVHPSVAGDQIAANEIFKGIAGIVRSSGR